jgi:hypothetical protein
VPFLFVRHLLRLLLDPCLASSLVSVLQYFVPAAVFRRKVLQRHYSLCGAHVAYCLTPAWRPRLILAWSSLCCSLLARFCSAVCVCMALIASTSRRLSDILTFESAISSAALMLYGALCAYCSTPPWRPRLLACCSILSPLQYFVVSFCSATIFLCGARLRPLFDACLAFSPGPRTVVVFSSASVVPFLFVRHSWCRLLDACLASLPLRALQ